MVLKREGDTKIIPMTMPFDNWHVDQIGSVDHDIGNLLSVVSEVDKRIGVVTVECRSLMTPTVKEANPRIEASVYELIGNTSGGVINPNVLMSHADSLQSSDDGIDRVNEGVDLKGIIVTAIVEVDFDSKRFPWPIIGE